MVLEVDWLESLGEVRVGWKKSTLKINMEGKWMCLQGDPTLSKSMVSLKTRIKNMKSGDSGCLVEFGEMTLITHEELPMAAEIQELLGKFPEICEAKSELPPRRLRDHSIQIKPEPPNVRPYRYPHSQKK